MQRFTESVQPFGGAVHRLTGSRTARRERNRLARVGTPAVEIEEISRVFEPRKKPPVVALDDVSLAIPPGEIHGLLGPNGAGKTTLVKILSTVLLPTSGRARVLGHDVVDETKAVRPLLGIVFGGERGLYWRLTGRQNLEYWGALYKLSPRETKARTQQLIERVGLAERADERVETYSRGMKQRACTSRGGWSAMRPCSSWTSRRPAWTRWPPASSAR